MWGDYFILSGEEAYLCKDRRSGSLRRLGVPGCGDDSIE
jgi:hypothetical protein